MLIKGGKGAKERQRRKKRKSPTTLDTETESPQSSPKKGEVPYRALAGDTGRGREKSIGAASVSDERFTSGQYGLDFPLLFHRTNYKFLFYCPS